MRWWRFAVVLAVMVGLGCAAIGSIDPSGLLCVLPALLLGCVLLARRYPGEQLLLRMTRVRTPTRRRAGAFRTASLRRAGQMPRGGLLMAFALAVRPPPHAPAAS